MAVVEQRKNRAENLPGLLSRAAETYKRALIGHQPGLTWDYVVLTAANEHQAAGYRHEVAVRASGAGPLGAFFPASQQSIVVPDPPGFRAGSGGATFGVLRAIAQHQKAIGDRKPFDALRILLIHSGGASQRLPLYSPLGKIFAPLPLVRPDGQLMTLFDHLYLMLAALPARVGPGMLVAAGDVFLLFDATEMPKPLPGVTALSMRTPAELGEHHGVFKVEARSQKPGVRSQKGVGTTDGATAFPLVETTMQKATVEQMRSAGVADAQDRVLIDSGLLFFDAASTTALYELSKKYTPAWHLKTRNQIDLYSEIVPAALRQNQPVLSGDLVVRKLQSDLRAALKDSPLRCYELPTAHFQHLGTTRQLRDAMAGLDRSPACALFQQNVRFASEAKIPASARIYQSVITSSKVRVEENVVIENCLIESALKVGRGSVLSNLAIHTETGTIPAETLLYGVPLQDGKQARNVAIISGIHDDPKTDRTLCNLDLRHWLTLAGLTPDDLWSKDEKKRVLWTARLYPAFEAGKSLGILWIAEPQTLTSAQRAAWRSARRYSMADVLELADATGMAVHRDTISGMLQATEWINAVSSGRATSVQNSINHFGSSGYQQLVNEIHDEASGSKRGLLARARLSWTLAEIIARPHFPRETVKLPASPQKLQASAFGYITDAMTPKESRGRKSRIEAEMLTASAPVRLDFAGGWTDTPPYCLENGGAVVNVAINLNDVEPIQSSFKALDEPIVRLVSRDLGRTLVVSDPMKLLKPVEPGDPFSLQIVAMRLSGLAPTTQENSMRKWLSRVSKKGKGFEITTASNLPKGSGMGTSSILGATTLAVLRAATGQDTKHATLFEQTLLLEQHLGTGGGWQDQVGGIVGGAKITETHPGIPQKLRVRSIPLSATQTRALEDRLVVYFTGQQRLARNILREVMGRYLSREPGTMVLFNELVHAARAAESAIRASDWLSCATEINRYWRIKKDLFAGSTTPAIDGMFLELRPYYLGGCLAGAGGGGFAFFLCGDADQAHRLRTELRNISTRPGSLGLTFAASINRVGLRVF